MKKALASDPPRDDMVLACGWCTSVNGYGTGWVDWALGLYVLALALGALDGQRPKRARKLAGRLAKRNEPVSDELRALLNDRVSRAVNYGSLLVFGAIRALMAFKP